MNPRVLGLALAVTGGSIGAAAGEPVRLTFDGRQKFSPVVCNDGDNLVYVDFERPNLYRLKRMPLAGGDPVDLHPEATTFEFEPAWARQAPVYAYAHARGTLSISVIIRRDGQQLAEILPGGGFDGLRSPAVSADGARVLYCHAERGRQQIFSVAPDGSGPVSLTDSAGNNNWPDFDCEGRQIVFASSRTDDYEIYVMDAEGKNVRRLTDSPLQDIRPRFSPDGLQIAFTSHRDGNPELYVMQSDGGDVRRVTSREERDDYAAWHPSGRQLVAVCERDGEHDLYLLDLD
ncbi:MAG: PD40 domain-containing protein [Planctomycetaceae bacterium]|nr:PD40 domain-containing protein [Planctomycetaceae bacterium]